MGLQQNTKTCKSKNGKRDRGMNTKHNVIVLRRMLALCNQPRPSLPQAIWTLNKHILHASAARSLASLGSAQLAPNGAQKSSQRSPRETPKRCKETTTRVAGKAFESSPERPRKAPEKPPKGFQEIIKQFAAKASESIPERPREAPERPLEWPLKSLGEVQERTQRSTRQKAPQLAPKKLQRDSQNH